MNNRLILFILTWFPSLLFAAEEPSRNPLNFTPPATDMSIKYLGAIFGNVDGVLAGTGTQIVGTMFGVFNAAVLAIGGLILIYTLVVSTLNTAQEGQFMGQRWNSIWVPVRAVVGLALLIPKQSGYCVLQIMIMWIVVQGVGAADKVWDAALGYLGRGGTIVDYNRATNSGGYGGNQEFKGVAQTMLQATVCMAAIQKYLEQERENIRNPAQYYQRRGQQDPGSVPDFLRSVNILAAHNSAARSVDRRRADRASVTFPNFPASHSYSAYNSACGSMNWEKMTEESARFFIEQHTSLDRGNRSLLENAVKQSSLARGIAVNSMYISASTTARQIVSNYMDKKTVDQLPLGKLSTDRRLWQSPNNKPTLLKGLELHNSSTNYFTIMSPTLRLLNRSIMTETKFIQKAHEEGWIMAGSYFYNLIALNKRMNVSEDPDKVMLDKSNAMTFGSTACARSNPPAYCPLTQKIRSDENIQRYFFTPNGEYSKALQAMMMFRVDGVTNRSKFKVPEVKFRAFEIPYLSDRDINKLKIKEWGLQAWIANNLLTIIQQLLNFFITILNSGIKTIQHLVSLVVLPLFVILASLKSLLVQGDPIVQLALLGDWLIDITGHLWGMLLVYTAIVGAVPILGMGLIPMLMLLIPPVLAFFSVLVAGAVVMVYYVPLIPFIIFTFGALGWFVAVVEAMIAGPIVALGVTHPDAQSQAFGKAEPALMILLNIFLRPSIMILAFILAILLTHAGIWLLVNGFDRTVELMLGSLFGTGGGRNVGFSPEIADNIASGTSYLRQSIIEAGGGRWLGDLFTPSSNEKSFFTAMFAPLVLFILFVTIYQQIIRRSFDIVYILPDKVLRYIGGNPEDYGRQYSETMGAIEGRMNQAGQTAQGAFKAPPMPSKGPSGGGGGGGSDAPAELEEKK